MELLVKGKVKHFSASLVIEKERERGNATVWRRSKSLYLIYEDKIEVYLFL